ncbi:hypothetical protein LLG95_15865 [bacterium]|nr:hypothetical protein [bacterium]
MVETSAISALESAAADLGKLLSGWTRDRVAEAEAQSKRPDLAMINDGIQSLWRLVSVQKSILQLKTAPSPPAPEFRSGVQTSVCSGNHSPNRQSPIVNRQSPPPSSTVPSVPVVPSAPTYHSIETIAAKTKKLYDQTVALVSANGLAVPGDADLPIDESPIGNVPFPGSANSNRKPTDQIKTKLLDAITNRPMFPGSGNLLNSLRAEFQTSPP